MENENRRLLFTHQQVTILRRLIKKSDQILLF